jgi:glutaconate CoA-transferase subunit B
MSTNCAGYYIVMQRHEPRTFVERVDLITALGDRAERERLRLPGGGPRFVLSPLGVFDFDADGEMKIRSLHEGVSLEQVREATGFELSADGDGEPPATEPPSAAELELLRERVDVERTLA